MVLILQQTTMITAEIVEDFRINTGKRMENVVSVGTIGSQIQEIMKHLEACTQPVPSLIAIHQDKLSL
jgi:ribosomal protein S15P/S13E